MIGSPMQEDFQGVAGGDPVHDNTNPRRYLGIPQSTLIELATVIALFVFGFVVAFWRVERTGEVWLNDGSRYLNNGAMIYDWLSSDRLLDPFGFAVENYVQFPGHSIPYHPPGYALMLAVWFKVFGLSYFSARAFIAACLGMCLLAFRQIIIELNESRKTGFVSALILGSIPQVVIWSRTSMSELPGMVFILWGTYFFLVSLRARSSNERALNSALATGFAMVAFMCRISTAGVLPAWYLLLLRSKGVRKSITLAYIVPAIVYLVAGVCWIKFAGQYSKNEMRTSLLDNLMGCLTYENVTVWWVKLPAMVSIWVFALALFGWGAKHFSNADRKHSWFLWTAWICCYYVFQVIQNLPFEARYFIFALPGVVGLIGVLLSSVSSNRRLYWGFYGLSFATVILNLWTSQFQAPGLVGYDAVAQMLGERSERGNIMITAYADADLIFRLRCEKSMHTLERQLIRGDRVLAIRNPKYSGAKTTILAKTHQDVYEALSQGRVRFVVTEGPLSDDDGTIQEQEVQLCHQALVANPQDYEQVGVQVLRMGRRERSIYVWRYRGELLEGKSTLPVVVPTAKLEIR